MATETLSRSLLSKFLIADQIALSLALLVGASLFGRTLRNLQNVDLGFERESIAIFEIDPMSVGYSGQRLRTFYDQFLERTRTLSGVRTAALAAMTPISNHVVASFFAKKSVKPEDMQKPIAVNYSNPVSSGYFATMGIPLLAGRDFWREDEPVVVSTRGGLPRVCIVDQSLARQQFGTVNAVGHRFCHSGFDCSVDEGIEVIGVVKECTMVKSPNPTQSGLSTSPVGQTAPTRAGWRCGLPGAPPR